MRTSINRITKSTSQISLPKEIGDVISYYLPECTQDEDFREGTPEFKEMLSQIVDVIRKHLPDWEECLK